MTSVRTNSIALTLFSLLIAFGAIHIAAASEITGTLSSDGSNETQQSETVSGETNTAPTTVTSQTTKQTNDGQLQGSVVGGRDESAALAAAKGLASPNNATWLVLGAGVAIAAIAFFLWRRRVI